MVQCWRIPFETGAVVHVVYSALYEVVLRDTFVCVCTCIDFSAMDGYAVSLDGFKVIC